MKSYLMDVVAKYPLGSTRMVRMWTKKDTVVYERSYRASLGMVGWMMTSRSSVASMTVMRFLIG